MPEPSSPTRASIFWCAPSARSCGVGHRRTSSSSAARPGSRMGRHVEPGRTRAARVGRELGVGNHVTFTGRIPHADVKDLYSIADVVAYPRRLTRTTALTTPLKPLEAMSMARAVVVSDVPPMKELVQDRSTGLLFKSGDYQDLAARCLELLSNPMLRSELGNTARDWVVRERHWPVLINGYRAIYESVLGRAARHDERVPA